MLCLIKNQLEVSKPVTANLASSSRKEIDVGQSYVKEFTSSVIATRRVPPYRITVLVYITTWLN